MAVSRVKLSDGAELSVHVDGSGPDVMLVTGLGGTAVYWDPTVAALSKNYRVIRFDQRGIGASTRGSAFTDIAQLGRDANAVLEHVSSNRAVLLGHSTGGVILQSMALESQARIAGLVLSGTWAKLNRYMTELFRSRAAVLKVLPQEYSAGVAFLGYTADWLNANWATYDAIRAGAPTSAEQQKVVAERIEAILTFERSQDLHRITVPTLVQGAEDDLIVPAFLNHELAGMIKHAEVQMFPTGGHMFPVTRTPAFVDVLTKFARKCHG